MAPVATSINVTEKAWSKTASNYASNVGRSSVVVAGRLIELANSLRPIDSTSNVLDVGAGTGAVSLTVAHEYPESSILATDISPKMLSVIDGHKLRNISTSIVDAHELNSLDDHFSHAFLSFMLQLSKTPMTVLEGMRDRLEGNGVIGLAIWGKRADPFEIWQKACQTIDPSYTNGAEFDDPHAWRTTEELKAHMESAGLTDVIVEDITTSFEFQSTDAFMAFWFNANNPAALLVINKWKGDFSLAREAVKKVCREQYQDGKSIELQGALGVGRKSC